MENDLHKPHYENEVPFEVPQGWSWCKLDDLALYKKGPFGSSLTKSMFVPDSPNAYKVYEQKNAINKDASLGHYFIDKDKFEELRGFEVKSEDIIVSCAGTIGETYVLPRNLREGIINQALMFIRLFDKSISDFYLLYFDFILKSEAAKESKGTAIKNIPPFDILKNFFMPLPPIEEQKRIIEKVSYWFSYIDAIDNDCLELNNFIIKTKSKILDLSIRGKLVSQDPNDEPAIDLLKRINPKFTPCDNAHYPFDVPNNWIWAKGLDIFKPMKTTSPSGDTFKYIDIDAVDNKRNVITSVKLLNTKQAPSRASRYTENGCVLFSMVRPYLRNIAIVTEDDCIASTGFFVCHGEVCLLPKFSYFQMLSNYVVDGLNDFMKGDNSPSITKAQIEDFLFPLPPLNEQRRIVSKIEELFAVLDKIKKSIEA